MLRPEHIMHLKIDREQYSRYCKMPPPNHVTKALTHQFITIGNIVIAELMGVPSDIFQMQLEAAQSYGASYLMEDKNHRGIGISATTSLIRDDDILRKNVIIAHDMKALSHSLRANCILGIFVKGSVEHGILQDIQDVNVAGWLTSGEIDGVKKFTAPPTFTSRLDVDMVPCKRLRPISTLRESLDLLIAH